MILFKMIIKKAVANTIHSKYIINHAMSSRFSSLTCTQQRPKSAFTFLHDLCYCVNLLKEEGKDQELIQSSTTPDPGHHTGERQKQKKISYRPALSLQVTTRL